LEGSFQDCSETVIESGLLQSQGLHYGLHSQRKYVVQHLRNQQIQYLRTVVSDGRVCVHLNQPELERRVDHEVETKQLEIKLLLFRTPLFFSLAPQHQGLDARLDDVDTALFDLLFEGFPDGALPSLFLILLVNVPAERRFRDLVAFFVFAVVVGLRLDCVVSEVDQSIGGLDVELFT
jgi:hypothetical protein